MLKEVCDKCHKDISELFAIPEDSFEEKVEYNNEKDLLFCEVCYAIEVVFITTQKQRRISNYEEKAYIIYEGKVTTPENLLRLSISSPSNLFKNSKSKKKEYLSWKNKILN